MMKFFTHIFWNTNEKRLRALWRILFQLAIFVWFAGLCSLPIIFLNYFIKKGINLEDPIISLISAAALMVAMLISLWACGHWVDRRSISNYGFHFSRRWMTDFAFGLFLGAFLMGIIFAIEYLAGWVTISAFLTRADANTPFFIGLIETIALFLMVGFYEESFSRGYQLRNIAEGLNLGPISPSTSLVIAWGVSSSLFGLLHAGNPNATWISTLNLVLAGLFLGLGFVLTGDLAISIGLHITWNFFQGNIFGFPVSGTSPIVSFIGISQKGSDLFTGGAFGPEAGLLGLSAILLGSILILVWVYTTRKQIRLASSLSVYKPGQ
jgi:uncharacterized protein